MFFFGKLLNFDFEENVGNNKYYFIAKVGIESIMYISSYFYNIFIYVCCDSPMTKTLSSHEY